VEAIRDTTTAEPAPPDTTAAEEEEGPSPDDAAAEADSVLDGAVEADSLAAGAEAETSEEGTLPEEEKLPSQTLRIQLATPLESGTYRLILDRIVNLRLLEAEVDTTFSYPLMEDEGASP
jgi:hypothetical protein